MSRRFYVDGRWGQVHARTAGAGAPLLLLHQSPLSGAMFAPALPLLTGVEAVAIDTPGFGLSDSPPGPVAIEDYAEALLPVLDALGWARPHLLGHHTGAAIAAAFAARHPDRVARLVLNGVPLFSPEERAHFEGFRFGPLRPEPDGNHLLAAWNQRLAATPGWTDLDAMHGHVVAMLAVNRTYWWGFQAAMAYDIAPDLAAIRAPALILTNTGEDLYAASRRAAALRPDFAFVALDGGTHDIVDEQPAAWARAVSDFLVPPAQA